MCAGIKGENRFKPLYALDELQENSCISKLFQAISTSCPGLQKNWKIVNKPTLLRLGLALGSRFPNMTSDMEYLDFGGPKLRHLSGA